MNVYETTITQDMVFHFWLMALTNHYPVSIYQSTDEKANGDDLEICIQINKRYVIFPCQAKIVNANSKYRRITHKVNGRYQLDMLLDYGARIKGVPMYLFYNYHPKEHENDLLEKQHNLRITEFGCSFCSAKEIKKAYWKSKPGKVTIPGFYELHKTIAFPFAELFCSVGTMKILDKTETPLSEVQFYEYSQLTNPQRWNSLNPPAAIGRVLDPAPEPEQSTREEPPASFNPKFRIILSTERGKSHPGIN